MNASAAAARPASVATGARVWHCRVGRLARPGATSDARWRVRSTADHLKSQDEHHSPEVTDILKTGEEGEGTRQRPMRLPDHAGKCRAAAAASLPLPSAASSVPPLVCPHFPPRPQMWRS